ncbi:MAG TPA: hypothetical protein VFY39_07945 [Gammaproteobacteria bacterium]|nr:hypothetical protein [Gammaproteobacteria bacterium]
MTNYDEQAVVGQDSFWHGTCRGKIIGNGCGYGVAGAATEKAVQQHNDKDHDSD